MQGWNSSLSISKGEKQRHYDLQTLCNGVIMFSLNYKELFLRMGGSFLFYIFKPWHKCTYSALVDSWLNIPHLGCEVNT